MNETMKNPPMPQDTEGICAEMQGMNDAMDQMENLSQQELLDQIDQVSFAVNDMQLYLDTHPNCREGLRFMERHQKKRRRLLDIYAEKHGPLTMDSMQMSGEDQWKWMQQPFPWQQKGGCR